MTASELKSIRERAGLTQSGLAALLRLSDSRTIRRYEDGSREISGPVAMLLEMLDAGELPKRFRP
ncbi:helix-turn-helix domain-containing protein [Tsuneonella sp. HG222]